MTSKIIKLKLNKLKKGKRKKNIFNKNKLSILILLFLLVTVFYPLLEMLLRVQWSNFSTLIKSSAFQEAMQNSLFVTTISTILSITIAYILAYTLNKTNIEHRAILKVFLTLPMLIPSISHGLGLINLFGTNGIISSLIGFNVIGVPGIIVGSILYSFPVAFLMLDDGFNYIDNTMYDNAKVLGLNKWQTFKKVTFCYLKKPIFSSIFAVFTLIFTDYGVPLAVGGKFITLPVFLYKEVIGLLDFSKGTMIGLFLLIPAIISFLFDNFSRDYTNGEIKKKYIISSSKIKDILLTIFVYIILILIITILGSFVYYAFLNDSTIDNSLSLRHFEYIIDNNVGKNIFNSLFIAILVAFIGTIISYFTAYATARIQDKSSKIIHILTISSLAVPGIVLGLSYTIGFKNSFIYNTYIILIVVNIVHFMASPYLMAYNALQKVNKNYEIVAKTFNINMFRTLKDIIIPCTKKTIREMFAYFFVNSMVTISAVTFLFNTTNMPLSLLINNYEGNMMLGEAAIISLIILFCNIVVKGIVYIINRKEHRRSELNGSYI